MSAFTHSQFEVMEPEELRYIRENKLNLTQAKMALKLQMSLRGYKQYELHERPIPGPVKLLTRIWATQGTTDN